MLWVKGSGGDLGSMKLDGFSTLYLDKLEALKGLYRGIAHEDEMVRLPARIAPSISIRAPPRSTRRSTPSCRMRHVDHVHSDAVIAIAARRMPKN